MMWDEFPLPLYNISKRDGERLVIEPLDELLALRQQQTPQSAILWCST
jgi:hypothetical protein